MALSRSTLFLLFVLALLALDTAIADPEFTWVNAIGGTDDDTPADVATDGNNDVIVTGSFTGTISFDAGTSLTADDGSDFYVAKYSPGGSLLWARKYGGTGEQVSNAITIDGNGNILIAGAFESEISVGATRLTDSSGEAFFTKLAEDGEPIWLRQTGGLQTTASAIQLDGLGNIVLAGTIFGRSAAVFGTDSLVPTTDGASDGFVAKFSPDGSRFRWVQQLESDLNVFSLDLAVGSNVYVTGSMNASMSVDGVLLAGFPPPALGYEFDGFVVTLDGATGARVDAHLAGGRGINAERGLSITTDASGNALATGWFKGTVPDDDPWRITPWAGGNDIYLAAHNRSGAPIWNEFAGGPNSDTGTAVTIDDSGAVVAGTFQGDWTLAGTAVSGPPGSGTAPDMLVAHYTRNPAASRGWDWVVTAGSAEQDAPTAVAADGANDILVSGAVGASPATFGTLSLMGAGGAEAFVAKVADPGEPPPEDPYEEDPLVDLEWELVRWQCTDYRTPPPCPDVFRDNFIDYPAETVWTLQIDDLALTTQDDIDRFVVSLPEPAARTLGDRYFNISAAPFVDIEPMDGRDDDTDRPAEPLLECHSVEREVPGPDPRGVRTIRVTTGGHLTVEVIPSGADPLGLSGERTVISDGGVDLARGAAADPVTKSCPLTPPYDPRVEDRPPNRTQLNVTVGEREGLRARSALGTYDLLLTYRIPTYRVGPPWVLDQMAAKGIRELGNIFCARNGGPGFPRCPAGPDGFSVIEFLHPGLSDIFNCFADGPGCWDIRQFYWPATETPFDLVLEANEDLRLTLFDEQQNIIAEAAPTNLVHGVDTAVPFTKQISQTQLAEGRYFLVIEGQPTTVSARFTAPQEMQPPAPTGVNWLWLAALLIVLIVAVVLFRRRAVP